MEWSVYYHEQERKIDFPVSTEHETGCFRWVGREEEAYLREHAHLLHDIAPISRSAEMVFQQLTQLASSGAQLERHLLHIFFPDRSQPAFVFEDGLDNTGPERRLCARLCARKQLHVSFHATRDVAVRGRHEQNANSFSVQSERFAVGRRYEEVDVGEDADTFEVSECVARHESRIGGIEKGKVLASTEDAGELTPLVRGRVTAGRTLSTGLQHDHRSMGDFLQGFGQFLKLNRF